MARKTTFGTSTQLTASMADLGSIVRLNPNNFNTIHSSFVFDKALQLIETPVANPIVNPLSSSLFPNSFEVFYNNLISFKVGNNILTYAMIYPLHPTSFSSREISKQSLAGTSAFILKFGTQILELPFDLLDFSRIVKPTVGSDSKVIYSEVNAQNMVLRTNVLLSGSNLFRECEQEKTPSFFIHAKQTLLNTPTEIIRITSRNVQVELLPIFQQSYNECISFQVSTSWEVIPDGSSFNNWLCLGSLDHPTSLPHTSDCYLGRQFKSFPNSLVDFIMQFEVLSDFMLPSIINAELQGFSVSFDSPDYLRTGSNLNFGSDIRSHNNMVEEHLYKPYGYMSSAKGGTGFLPQQWVSALTIS